MSGAVYYQQTKVRRTKFLGNGEPTFQFMPNIIALVNRVLIVNLLLLLLTSLILNVWLFNS
jgi:adenosylcobinamide-phosphate synthase